jgi:hypothetical protein
MIFEICYYFTLATILEGEAVCVCVSKENTSDEINNNYYNNNVKLRPRFATCYKVHFPDT